MASLHATDTCSKATSSVSPARPTPTNSLSSTDVPLNGKISSPPYYECDKCNCLFSDERKFRLHVEIQHFEGDQCSSAIDAQTPGLDRIGQSSSSIQGQCYFCGQCGQELTVRVNTSDEIVLSANCGCSVGLIAVSSRPDPPLGEDSFNDVDELSRTEMCGVDDDGDHDDGDLVNDLQLLHSSLLRVE